MSRTLFSRDVRRATTKIATVAAALFVVGASALWAQSTELEEGKASRYPDTGVAVLDCAPAAPAPKDSCVVRVPPNQLRGTLRRAAVGEETGKFKFVRPGQDLFPKNLTLSETIVLIDLTPGPKGGRSKTFYTEKKLIRQFVKSLPAGERIAIYGFGEKIHRLADFSTDRSAALNAIDALKLTSVNTLLSTYSKDAIGILAKRDQAVLKNLFIISDGEEEGTSDAAGVAAAAIKANVTVSSLGMFWRKTGDAITAKHMEYMRQLTENTLGHSVQIPLKNAAVAEKALSKFQSVLNASMTSSGLILPVGTAYPADITVVMQVPDVGTSGIYHDEEVSVRFTPAKVEDAPDTEGDDSADDEHKIVDQPEMLFGYPALWVYAAAGALALLLLLLLLLILRRKKSTDEFDAGEFDDDTDVGFGDASSDKTRLTPAPAPRPAAAHAYLVNTVTRQKRPLTGARVTIGRDNSNTLILEDDSVSRMHCEIIRNREGGYTVSDLDSLNGTYINSKKVDGAGHLNAGDEIKFGEITMRFVLA